MSKEITSLSSTSSSSAPVSWGTRLNGALCTAGFLARELKIDEVLPSTVKDQGMTAAQMKKKLKVKQSNGADLTVKEYKITLTEMTIKIKETLNIEKIACFKCNEKFNGYPKNIWRLYRHMRKDSQRHSCGIVGAR
jgi:hypothetical protein